MPRVGRSFGLDIPVLTWIFLKSKMHTPVVSLPVPAVVGTAIVSEKFNNIFTKQSIKPYLL